MSDREDMPVWVVFVFIGMMMLVLAFGLRHNHESGCRALAATVQPSDSARVRKICFGEKP